MKAHKIVGYDKNDWENNDESILMSGRGQRCVTLEIRSGQGMVEKGIVLLDEEALRTMALWYDMMKDDGVDVRKELAKYRKEHKEFQRRRFQ